MKQQDDAQKMVTDAWDISGTLGTSREELDRSVAEKTKAYVLKYHAEPREVIEDYNRQKAATTWHEGDRALYGLTAEQAAYHRGPWTQHGLMVCREPSPYGASYQNHFPTEAMAAAVCRFLNQWEASSAD